MKTIKSLYSGYSIEEGLRPKKGDLDQYFFVVDKEGKRVFRYCIWLDRKNLPGNAPKIELVDNLEENKEFLKYLQQKGIARVKEKIDNKDFSNQALKLLRNKEEEILLEEKD